VVAGMAQDVNVMYAGSLIETGPVKKIYGSPNHPYTLGLLSSLPRLDDISRSKLISIEGEPPDLVDLEPGCQFYERCKFAVERCSYETPALESVSNGHSVACWEIERVRKVQ